MCIRDRHHIVSHRIVSCRIASYRIASYRIPSYRIVSYPILSCCMPSYPIVLHPILSYPILSCPVLSYPTLCWLYLLGAPFAPTCQENKLVSIAAQKQGYSTIHHPTQHDQPYISSRAHLSLLSSLSVSTSAFLQASSVKQIPSMARMAHSYYPSTHYHETHLST